MPKHMTGKKISKSHTTLIEAAIPIAKALEKMPEVKKIAFGKIPKPINNGRHHLKIDNEPNGGLRLTVRGNRSIQTIYVSTSDSEKTKRELEKKFGQ